ncbi:NUDIX domain-containing protein [Kitasatospora sp. NBC_01300]|uniref:NUDIX domain-containing protein n=1 Tax=Kitasatospora sp. NBC_01300 TaxID=2903574 RepID=UPI00352BD4A7|nr:NUDIX domain-containing protein [Kitasatospora sp. NBC_01300]WSK08372.1 NUDIX domain-containing protein [Kitasatospora sp. NBC_01300]
MRDPRLLAKPPVCRLGCLVLVRNPRGDVLLVDPDYMDGLILPGGAAKPNEPPHLAAARHLHAETGLNLRLADVLAVDFTPADRYLERLNLVFDGGTLTEHAAAHLTVPPQHRSGLFGARFVPVRRLPDVMAPSQSARVSEALAGRALPVLLHGQRAT